jgi:hypothetical protein
MIAAIALHFNYSMRLAHKGKDCKPERHPLVTTKASSLLSKEQVLNSKFGHPKAMERNVIIGYPEDAGVGYRMGRLT